MRPIRHTILLAIGACVWAADGTRIGYAQAPSGSVQAIFQKHNLLGVFAEDCSKPASKNHRYYVYRLLGPNQVQLDEMAGSTDRVWAAVIDRAWEVGSNQIGFGGRLTGLVVDSRSVAGSQSVDGVPVEGYGRSKGIGCDTWRPRAPAR
jgi:hypothetical protein